MTFFFNREKIDSQVEIVVYNDFDNISKQFT